MVYENQDEVGAALKKVIPSVVKREELFITSKLWNSSHQPAQVEKELDDTLSKLGLDYLDLYRSSSRLSLGNLLSCLTLSRSYPLACRFPSRWRSFPSSSYQGGRGRY